MESYEAMLDRAYENVKQIGGTGERFEIPEVKGRFQGKKTILTNFFQIAAHLRRSPEHFQKFMLRELAASGQKEGERMVFNMRIPSKKINPKIAEYAKEFVVCRECGKPDTQLIKEGRITVMHCLACGAKHSVRSKI